MTKPEGLAQEPQRCGVCDWPIVDNGTRVEHIGFDHPAVPATPAPSQPAVTNRFCTRCGKLNDHTHELPTRDRHDRPAFTGCCGTPTTRLSYVNPQHRADCPLRTAPNQPAGAREWLKETRDWDRHGRGYIRKSDGRLELLDDTLEAYARQQTAAKDAELAQLRQQLDIWESNEPCEECGEAHECGVQAQLRDLRHEFGCEQQAREAAERERDSLREALNEILAFHLPGTGQQRGPSFTETDILRWKKLVGA